MAGMYLCELVLRQYPCGCLFLLRILFPLDVSVPTSDLLLKKRALPMNGLEREGCFGHAGQSPIHEDIGEMVFDRLQRGYQEQWWRS